MQYNKLNEEYNCLLKKHKELHINHLDVEQHSKRVETSLNKYIKEIEDLKQSNDEYRKELEISRPKLEYNTINNTRLEQELKVTSDNLSITIKAKNTTDDINYQLNLQLTELKAQVVTKDEAIATQKFEITGYKAKLYEYEREIVLYENKIEAVEKQADLTTTTLGDKIKMLESRLKHEVNTRESLIVQFNNEEKAHSETKKIYLNVASELEEYKLKVKNTENMLRSKVKILKEIINEKNNLQGTITKLETEKEALKTEKDKLIELSKKLEEFYKDKQKTKAIKKKEQIEEYELKLVQRQTMYEDIYSRCTYLYQLTNKYTIEVYLNIKNSAMN